MKLFTIGDSVAQGFMSGAAARTDQSFPTLIARAMGLSPGSPKMNGIDYYYPEWPAGGLPANLEVLMRALNNRFGFDIRGLEWAGVLPTINRVLDESEDYYERGAGAENKKYPGHVPYFHNISTWAFNVADSWLLTPEICRKEIEKLKPVSGSDNWMDCANASLYRTALKLLSPNLDKNYTQLDWLSHHTRGEGVENLVLWLGLNNALGTILTFQVNQTPGDPQNPPHRLSFRDRCRAGWNLWHPEDFRAEYRELLDRVDESMAGRNRCGDWKVFLGTIPLLTIAPLLKGVGPRTRVPHKGTYYKYYTYMTFGEEYALKTGLYLGFRDVLFIDDCIREYNRHIRDIAERKNLDRKKHRGKGPYYVVDICEALSRLAWKRNGGMSRYKYPDYFKYVHPPVDTRYYHADTLGRLQRGGIFSLDGVHPSGIGQGLLAHEFMKVMKGAGVSFKQELNWEEIFAGDTLYREPISLMQELHDHEKLAYFVIKKVQAMVRQLYAVA